MPTPFTTLYPKLFDLSLLTELRLHNYNMWLLSDVLAVSKSLCNLSHFESTSLDSILPEHSAILHDFFKQNDQLKCVHFSHCGLLYTTRYVVPEQVGLDGSLVETHIFWPLRDRLRSLAW